mgnify:CR=1 FL=1
MLTVDHLSFAYNGQAVLRDISARVAPGEILAVLGPNGAGKSTLLRCMAGFLPPDEGCVRIADQDISHVSSAALARTVAYLPQQLESCRLAVFDAVLLGRLPHQGRTGRREDRTRAAEVLHRLALEHLALRSLDTLSGGELQTVAIARALVQAPGLLLLDEPTSALDLANRTEILRLVRRLAQEEPMTVVMSMHDLSTALRYATRFLLLDHGRVHAQGPVDSLTADMIEAAYGVPVDILHHHGRPVVIPQDG